MNNAAPQVIHETVDIENAGFMKYCCLVSEITLKSGRMGSVNKHAPTHMFCTETILPHSSLICNKTRVAVNSFVTEAKLNKTQDEKIKNEATVWTESESW